MRKAMTLATIAVLMSVAGTAMGAEVEVKMLNKGTEGAMKFVATDKGHNAESIKGMMPADATPFVGKNGEDVAVTFDKPGAYGIKCLPHYGMGMVALIVVGTPGNLAEAKAVPQVGKAKQVFAALFDKLPTKAAEAK